MPLLKHKAPTAVIPPRAERASVISSIHNLSITDLPEYKKEWKEAKTLLDGFPSKLRYSSLRSFTPITGGDDPSP